MSRHLRMLAAFGSLLVAISASQASFAQKRGGVLLVHAGDSPPSMSMHETIGRPASIIVEKVREKMTRSLSGTLPLKDGSTNSVGFFLTFVMTRP